MIALRDAAHRVLFFVFLSLMTVLAACSGMGPQKEETLTCAPMTDIKEVEGNWEGVVKNVRTGKDAGRIVVALTSRDTYATFNFGGETAQGSLVGTGRVALQSGRLSSDSAQHTVVFTLCLRGSEQVLATHAFGKDGKPYYIELTRMK